MNIVRRPRLVLPGERLVAVHPPLSPDPVAGWSRRLRYHDGRALGDRALDIEQAVRGARMTTLAQVLSPGVVSGLEARLVGGDDEWRVRVEAGFGLTAAGRDVNLERAIECRIEDIPMYGFTGPGDGPWGHAQLTPEDQERVPHALVVVLEPVRVETLDAETPGVSATQSCALDPDNLAFADRQRVDGVRMWFYPWTGAPAPSGPWWRNHLAYYIFARQTRLGPDEAAPWSMLGVPVGLMAWAEHGPPIFDRHMVVRRAGRIGGRRPVVYLRRLDGHPDLTHEPVVAPVDEGPWDQTRPAWWQARIDQFAEQLANEPPIPMGETLASRYRFLPPVGVLPPDAVTVRPAVGGRDIIPPSFHLRAVPVCVEALDDVVRASAGLAPFNVFVEDQMEVLVPVPQAWFEPALLVEEEVDPRFAAEVAEIEGLLSIATMLRQKATDFELAMTRARVGPPAPVGDYTVGYSADGDALQAQIDALDADFDPDPTRRAHLVALRNVARAGQAVEEDVAAWSDALYDGARDDVAGPVDAIDGADARLEWMLARFQAPAAGSTEEQMVGYGIERLITRVGDLVEQADELIDFNLLRVQASVVRFKEIFSDNVTGTRLNESEAFSALAPKAVEPAPESFDAVAATIGFAPQTLIYGQTLPDLQDIQQVAMTDEQLRAALRDAASAAGAPDPDFVDRLDLSRLRNSLTPIAARRIGDVPARPQPIVDAGGVREMLLDDAGRIQFERFDPQDPLQVQVVVETLAQQISAVDLQGAEFYQAAAEPLVAPIQQYSMLQSAMLLRQVRDFRTQFEVKLPAPAAASARDEALDARNALIDKLKALHLAGHDLSHLDFSANGVDLSTATPEQVITRLDVLRRTPPEPDEPGDGELRDQALSLVHGSRATEQTAKLLRLVRRRTAGFKRLLRRLNQALPPLRGFAQGSTRVLAGAEAQYTELSHDHAVAQALYADEIARVDAINDRRDGIVRDHVDFLVFRRPRVVAERVAGPIAILEPANRPDPIPACLAGDYQPPPPLKAMLDLLRDAPLRWLTEGPALLDRLQRLEAMDKLLDHGRLRASEAKAPTLATDALDAGLGAVIRTLFGQRATLLVQQRKQAVAARVTVRSWKAARDAALASTTLGDLLDAPHGQTAATRAAGQAFGDIGEVATCLYARLRALDAVIRLEWTRRLSVFDAPIDLRRLSVLPRWAEVDRVDRRELQAYVDWLYGRVDVEITDARALIRDLVRFAVLLASHAPVNQILRGAVVRPRPLAIGGRIELAVDVAQARIGAHVQLFEMVDGVSTLVGRGVVDDLAAGLATVKVLDASKASIEPSEGTIAEPSALGGTGWQLGPAGLLAK